ncbi:putative disease resistance protein RGA3 [Tripterygium wilfordii]|uniref:putative disease resistance protein RGA3 n=1 Tax=Tripterygium wilfordii TaxID=458696 RepID=UPI0018F85AF5|nr:putative disease resistance protein RGA3 [Tripterygium wilfordii]
MKVCRFFSSSNPLVFRFKMGHKVKELRESFDEIAAQKSIFHLTELGDSKPVGHRVRELTDSFVLMSKVFGREAEKERIMSFLLQPRGKSVGVIPIVGLGGLGKTTLAKMLYNDNRIDEHFPLKMWVCISEDGFDKKKTLVKIMNSITKQNLSDYDLGEMQISIREKLNGKKFMLVLDDVWSANRNEWVELLDLLEESESGSKIIVTTRSNSVAKTTGTTGAYELEGLPFEDCFSLFKKLVFNEGEAERYPNLVEIGNDIVDRCKGVPLAIRTLGSLLYANKNEQDWISIRDNEIWRLDQGEEDILPVLKLSYDQLPPYLKPCFAICSIFPKDYDFLSHEVTQLWMAHGLLQSSNGKEELEDIGLRYIKELCSRSFFQDIWDFGYIWSFRMHDLVHDLAMSMAHDECLVVNERIRNISKGTRHISVFDVRALHDIEDPKSLRTVKFEICPTESPVWLSTCRHLRMLVLRSSSSGVLPLIGGLKHLRYLHLTFDERIKKLPDSFWKLHNLQILYLKGCVEELPRDIRKLIRLRSLVFTTKQKRLPNDGLSSLKHLHSLIVADCTDLEVLFEEKQDVALLRLLFIKSCENLISLAPTPKFFAALENLIIENCPRLNLTEGVDIDQDIESRLHFLYIKGLPQLKTLPQWLQRSSKTLQDMAIINCENLSALPEWLPIFKSLKRLVLENCPKLSTLPEEGISHLTALESLVIAHCPALSERYKRNAGEGWDKIAHIPNIIFY